jgi:hypothetical protein
MTKPLPLSLASLALAATFTLATPLAAQQAGGDPGWPREITTDKGSIVIYQPQPEKLEGDKLSGRAAMAIKKTGQEEPIFGAFWYTGRIETNKDSGTTTFRDLKIERVRWPDATAEKQAELTAILESKFPAAGLRISLDRLTAGLAAADQETKSAEQLKNDPPAIIVRKQASVLLLYDGAPRFEDVPNSDYQRVANTPMLVARKKNAKEYLLSGGKVWYSAPDPLGPWTPGAKAPADLVKMLPADTSSEPAPNPPPAIVVATEPTELIAFEGDPSWASLGTGDLIYAKNTEDVVIREVATQYLYVLLSGRWFKTASLENGPWTFVRSDNLPEAFSKIPPGSDLGGARVSVAGTEEATDALLDAAIPQTAAIKRSEATFDVVYGGGEPEFKKIEGTSVEYAINTGAQVLRIQGRYYAVDNGVWFTSGSAKGPWTVADQVPEQEIQKIPPSAPVYNVTYVHIYQSTPQVVYVGYTPGYMWSYPYYGTVVYGTGWIYPVYVGPVYYPRPVTFGVHVHYNPWTGWSYGVGWSYGFMYVGVSFGGGWGGYYRPGYWRPPYYRPGYGCCGGGWYGPGGYHRPPGYRPGHRPRPYAAGYADGRYDQRVKQNRQNLYQRPEAKPRVASPKDLPNQTGRVPTTRPSDPGLRDNNVYADRDGNAHRATKDGGWESREGGKWTKDNPPAKAPQPSKPTGAAPNPSQRPAPAAPSVDRTPSSLDRDRAARDRGTQRTTQRQTAGGGGGRRR